MFFKSQNIIGIGINNNNIELGYFKKLKNNAFELKSHKINKFNDLEIVDSVLFNPNNVSSYIQNFIDKNKIRNPNIYLYLTKSEKIKDLIITTTQLNSSRQELNINEDGPFIWGINSIGFDGELYYYYIVGIAQEILFQYKLLFLSLPCTLRKITTQNLALIKARKDFSINHEDLKNLKVENLSNNLFVSKKDKFILPNNCNASDSFLSTCYGMFI